MIGFFWYFERSPILQNYILGQFRRFMNEERETIDRDIDIFFNEADKGFDRSKDTCKEKKNNQDQEVNHVPGWRN